MKNHYPFLHPSSDCHSNKKTNHFIPKSSVIQHILSIAGSYWITKTDHSNVEIVERFLN